MANQALLLYNCIIIYSTSGEFNIGLLPSFFVDFVFFPLPQVYLSMAYQFLLMFPHEDQ